MKVSISGIRGIFGQDFTLKEVLRFCNNFPNLIESKKCVIANDTRPSANMIRETASAALMQNGIDVYNLGLVPTPVAFREAREFGAGLIITSSHNPIEWNGLKFIINGRGINEKELRDIQQEKQVKVEKIGTESVIDSNYVDDAVNLIGNVSSNPKVTVDIGGGSALNVAPNLLEKIGCKVNVINKNLNQTTRGPDPTADNLEDLISATSNADIGFAFDLDADRLVVVKDGKKQSPDVTLGLGIAKTLQMGYKKFVLSIDSSVSIEKYIKKNGGQVKRSKVGEANVIDEIINEEAQAGGEGSSGGFVLPEFNYCRDGLLTSGLIASMIGDGSFNDILNFMEEYHQIREKISVNSNLHDKVLDVVHDKISQNYSELSDLDGTKITIDEDSWALIRKSNTEDIIRISSESNDLEKAQKIQNEITELVNQSYDQVK